MRELRQRLEKLSPVPAKRERLGDASSRAKRLARKGEAWRGSSRRASRRGLVVGVAPSCRGCGDMTSTFGVAFQSARVTDAAGRIGNCPPLPNQTPEPTSLSVTDRAFARSAPASAVAHL